MVLANKKLLSYLKSKASIINQSSITTFYSNPQHINYIITDILDKKSHHLKLILLLLHPMNLLLHFSF